MTPHELAQLSLLAYRRHGESEAAWQDGLRCELRERGLHVLAVFDRCDTQCFVARRGDEVAIVFRGTEPERGVDVRTDLYAMPRRDRMGWVHAGFGVSLDYIWDELSALLKFLRWEGPHLRFYLAGHSMGGALAVITASRIIRDVRIGGLVTFGAPPSVRPFIGKLLSRMLNGDCIRVERADAVTMLLRTMYRSPGHRLYVTRDGQLIERSGFGPVLIDRLGVIAGSLRARWSALCRGRWAEALATPRLIAGHSMIGYRDALQPRGGRPDAQPRQPARAA